MSKITLNDVTSLENESSALVTINDNYDTIVDAFDNTLSRDGTTPNQMNSNLDMNSNHILNLPEPSSDTDPIRKIDLTNVSQVTNVLHTASVTSNTIGTGTKTFIVPSGLGFFPGQFILVQQAGNTANYMGGRVTSYSGTTLVTSMTAFGGSGTFTSWVIDLSGSPGATGNQGPPTNVYDTRTAAIAATIPGSVNFLQTLAYDSSMSDNSGSNFARVAAGTPFTDQFPLTGTIAGGAGYINGTYRGVSIGGSPTGNGMVATVTIAGGAVTALDYSTCPGTAYKVGDVLTTPTAFIGGTGAGFTYTITSISTPTASFINGVDSSHWQYLPNKGFVHVNEFGAKPDWNGFDAAATNNFYLIQNALFYAGHITGTDEGAGGYVGNNVQCSTGSYMLLSSPAVPLQVPTGVTLQGTGGTTLKFHDSFFGGINCINLGDPNSHLACFRTRLKDLTAFFKRGIIVNNDIYMVYSNNTQDFGGLDNVYLITGQRGGFKYELGYGGASEIRLHDVSFQWEGSNPGLQINVGTVVVDAKNCVFGTPASGTNNSVNAVQMQGAAGMYKFEGGHMEGMPNGFFVNLTGNSMVGINDFTGGNLMNQLVTIASTNTPGNLSMQRCAKNGATSLVVNGQPSGSSRTVDVRPSDGIVFFNP